MHFNNINTTVTMQDTQDMERVQLEVLYPKDNKMIAQFLNEMHKQEGKVVMNSENRIIFRCMVALDNKKFVTDIIEALKDLDEQFSVRASTVNEFMDLLK